jgi:hypothetical protein
VIFCEGEASEPDYINGLKRLPEVRRNNAINVEIDPDQGVPLTLVQLAIARKEADREVDEFWCVFDVEWPRHHPNLRRAIDLARANGIKLAISNPCFELWLILHFEDQRAFLTTTAAERKSRALDGRVGKRIDPQLYMGARAIAAERADALAARHLGDQSAFPDDNPSSSMHELLRSIES